jgi:GNAT superfamily N-acetyltransferase
MCALLQAGRAAANGTYYVHMGDLQWWLFYPPLDGDWWPHIYLWDDPADPARLLAWALIAPDGETFDVYVQPEWRGASQAMEVYAWGAARAAENARAAERPDTGVMWIARDDALLDGWLRDQGYRRWKEDVYMLCPFADPMPLAAIPEGFTVRGCRGEGEVTARAAAQYGAFGSSAPFDRYTQRWRNFMRSSAYDPELDVVAVDDTGRIGAFCIVWPDPLNQVGLFEPVGTHPDFQRRGLGRAVMTAALHRLQALGMTHAIVCTGEDNLPAIRLYESVGFRTVNQLGMYRKKR